jgi:hypothetical protein
MVSSDSSHSLLDYECLLFQVSDLALQLATSSGSVPADWHSTAEHWTSELPFVVSYERISWIHEWTLFYNFGKTE